MRDDCYQMVECGACRSNRVELILDLGMQPVSNHFTIRPDEPVVEHALVLSVCADCGTLQLTPPFPFRSLVPRFNWITYREPEGHLDAVVEKICGLGLTRGSAVLGLTTKDRSTLDRLARRGFENTRILNLGADLGFDCPNANVESVGGMLTAGTAKAVTRQCGHAELIIARHVLEHSQKCSEFLAALRELLTPAGVLMLEVPDCLGNLTRQDYTMIWEEHSYYFTRATLLGALHHAGFELLDLVAHRYPFEDVLIAYVRKTRSALDAVPIIKSSVAEQLTCARAFADAFPAHTRNSVASFDRIAAAGGRIAAYGAGHLTSAFLQFHRLTPYFAFVVDDTPEKQGLFLPKSGLPIVPRERLVADGVTTCLFGLNPEVEDKVAANCQDFLKAGGRFFSMLVDSNRSFRNLQ